jgi:uncharacterized membrane protein (DUF106 family)
MEIIATIITAIITSIITTIIAPIVLDWYKRRQSDKAMPNQHYFIKEVQKFVDSHYPKKK